MTERRGRCNVCGELEAEAYLETYGHGWARCLRCAEHFSPVTAHAPSAEGNTGEVSETMRQRLNLRYPGLGQQLDPQPGLAATCKGCDCGEGAYHAPTCRVELAQRRADTQSRLLREQIAESLYHNSFATRTSCLRQTDALLAGPLKPLLDAESDLNDELAQNVGLQEGVRVAATANQQLVDENNKLLAKLAESEKLFADYPGVVNNLVNANRKLARYEAER